jgi:hypothetical protein
MPERTDEEISYVAISPALNASREYIVGVLPEVDDKGVLITLNNANQQTPPTFFAAMQTSYNDETSTVRTTQLTQISATVYI